MIEISDGRIGEFTFFLDTKSLFPPSGCPTDSRRSRRAHAGDRSMPASTVIPVLDYAELGEAIDWLCGVFELRSAGAPEATALNSRSGTAQLR